MASEFLASRALAGYRKIVDTTVLFVYKQRYSLAFVAWCGSTYVLGSAFVYGFPNADGNSMYPTIPDGLTHLWVNKYYRRGRGIQTGDVVVFASPLFPGAMLNKRVIAMPGDIILRTGDRHPTPGDLPLCGITDWKKRLAAQRAIDEFGSMSKSSTENDDECPEPQMIQIPEGHVWVEGDNLAHSRDSRFFGPVPMALISGRTGYFRSHHLQMPQSLHAGEGFRKVPPHEIDAALADYVD